METIWLEINTTKMMSNEFIQFLYFLDENRMDFTSYYGIGENIYMEVTGDMNNYFIEQLSTIIYYQPIIGLAGEPENTERIINLLSNTIE